MKSYIHRENLNTVLKVFRVHVLDGFKLSHICVTMQQLDTPEMCSLSAPV